MIIFISRLITQHLFYVWSRKWLKIVKMPVINSHSPRSCIQVACFTQPTVETLNIILYCHMWQKTSNPHIEEAATRECLAFNWQIDLLLQLFSINKLHLWTRLSRHCMSFNDLFSVVCVDGGFCLHYGSHGIDHSPVTKWLIVVVIVLVSHDSDYYFSFLEYATDVGEGILHQHPLCFRLQIESHYDWPLLVTHICLFDWKLLRKKMRG